MEGSDQNFFLSFLMTLAIVLGWIHDVFYAESEHLFFWLPRMLAEASHATAILEAVCRMSYKKRRVA